MCTHILTNVYPHDTMYLQVKQHNNLTTTNNLMKGQVMTMKNTNINATLKELKEYNDMMKALKAEIEKLQDECKEYMIDNNVDEVISDDGIKATYREVISNRFDSTAFKKDFADIYSEYTKKSSSMRFTCN